MFLKFSIMCKKVSFSERCSMVYPIDPIKKDPIGFPKVVEKVVDGRIVKQVEFVIDDNSTDDYEFNDFTLDNLLAAGVQLKEMSFNTGSLSSADRTIESINNL